MKNVKKIADEIISKGEFTIEDRYRLDREIFRNIDSNFNTELTYAEKKIVQNIVKRNIAALMFATYEIIMHEDPLHLFKERDKYTALEVIKKTPLSTKKSDSTKFRIGIKHLLANCDINLEFKLTGEIPKKGLFCKRQSLANEWYTNYVESVLLIMSFIYENSNKEMAFSYVIANSAIFLSTNYPDEFSKKDNESDNEFFARIYDELVKYLASFHKVSDSLLL